MIDEYKKLLTSAVLRKDENKRFFEKLKKKGPKNLDLVCNDLHEKAFEKIDCLKCANCCRTTGPLLLQKDIERIAKSLKMRPVAFATTYLKVDEDNDNVFKSMPCPFIGDDNFCGIYSDKPNACSEFPHTQQRNILQKLKITYENTMICPAVAQIAEGLKKAYPL
jgi:Fe-S-cluster containining protein